MKVSDIFSWVSAKELSIEEIENLVMDLYHGNSRNMDYLLESQMPESADENMLSSANQLILEGKKVWYLIQKQNHNVAAVVGYRE